MPTNREPGRGNASKITPEAPRSTRHRSWPRVRAQKSGPDGAPHAYIARATMQDAALPRAGWDADRGPRGEPHGGLRSEPQREHGSTAESGAFGEVRFAEPDVRD